MKKSIAYLLFFVLASVFVTQFGPGYVYAKKSSFYKEFIVIEQSNQKILKLGEFEVCNYISGQLSRLEDSRSRNEIFFLLK